jgi:WD40 repeat protein
MLKGHFDEVWTIIELKDETENGDLLASGASDKTIKIWNYTNGSLVNTITGHQGSVSSVVSLNSTSLLSSSDDKTLRIWNWKRGGGVLLRTLYYSSRPKILDVNIKIIATGFEDNSIKLTLLETGKITNTLFGHTCAVHIVVFLTDVYLASASDFNIKIWNYTSGLELRSLLSSTIQLNSITLLNNGHLVSTSKDGLVNIWNYTAGILVDTFKESDPVYRSCLLKNGNLASVSLNGFISIFYSLDAYILKGKKSKKAGLLKMTAKYAIK